MILRVVCFLTYNLGVPRCEPLIFWGVGSMKIVKRFVILVMLFLITAPVFSASAVGYVHTVQAGDVLWRIAQAHGLSWEELAAYNGLENPHLITVGQRIYIPLAHVYMEYVAVQINESTLEYGVQIGGAWPVEGILTLPAGADAARPVPGVILVHGAGAMDRDGTLFEHNRPLYDIARFLSVHGIAVLRYDKANYIHGAEMLAHYGPSFTVWEETIEPALYAARLLHADPRISHVYLLGHHLGAMVAPRIHAAGGNFDGLILMAGTPLTLGEVVLAQNWQAHDYMWEQGDFQTAAHLSYLLMEMEDFLYTLPALSAEEAQALPFDRGLYAYYFRDFALHPTDVLLQEMNIPMLILQGANDFQMPFEIHFEAYHALLRERENVRFTIFPGINHFFMPSGANTVQAALDEYTFPSRVCTFVLQNIVEWVFSR